ncbi:Scr1 family TA system antitoxin-like transcriptional regulator [Streptomyces chartreusis]
MSHCSVGCEGRGRQEAPKRRHGGRATPWAFQLRTPESVYVDWRRKVRTGLKQLQNSYVPLFKSTKQFRGYSPTMVPALLETEGYARGLMTSISRFRDIPDDIVAAVTARLESSPIIHEPEHRFTMVIEEPALSYQLGDSDAMAAQLGYLQAIVARPDVRDA